ncbi:hypothetical protein MPSEU_001061000 [Mayamaea pseudoterrestris]|nr:hypothetical protein MPSEU_001061000 [Mayamaea pseudoterrestris]
MTKRRRSSSADSKKNDEKKHFIEVNPFLPDENEGDASSESWTKRSAILDHAIAFDEQSKSKKLSVECLHHAKTLIEFLKHPSNELALASLVADVALLLLQWSIHCLLSSSVIDDGTKLLCWKALSVSLECFSELTDSSVEQKLSHSSFSQSNLHKLVPRATEMAISRGRRTTSDDDGDAVALLAAKSLQLLLPRYRPSIENACQTVLSLVVESGANGDAIALMIIEWIASMMPAANPKTVFQIFSSQSILLILSKVYFGKKQQSKALQTRTVNSNSATETPVQLAMHQLFAVGLFDLKHHMEGLCSLMSTVNIDAKKIDKADNSFHCYQQNLLTTIECISHVDPADIPYLAMICPVLLGAFFRASKAWADVKAIKSTKKISSTERLARVQYKLFRHTVTTLEQLIVSPETLAMGAGVNAIRKCLAVLLEYEVYLPSQDDKDASQFRFLEEILRQFLRLGPTTVKILVDALAGLRTLVLLDHRLVSDRLSELFVFCLQSSDGKLSEQALNVLAATVDIYRQLRQQGSFFESLTEFIGNSQECLSESNILLNHMLNQNLLVEAIAAAVETCPFIQIEQLLANMSKQFQRLLQQTIKDDSGLEVLVTFAVLVMRNIGVEREYASTISVFCHGFVQSLTSESPDMSDVGIKQKAMFSLCAWSIALNTRAAFWMGRASEVRVPKSLLMKGQDDNVSGELLLLLGHRLRELHGLVYESERIETYENGSQEDVNASLVREARQTAERIAELSEQCCDEEHRNARWSIVASHCLSSWICYASNDSIDSMLRWLFVHALSTGKDEVGVTNILLDATFYEHPNIMSRFASTALLVADQWVAHARSVSSEVNTVVQNLRKAASLVNVLNGILCKNSGYVTSMYCPKTVIQAMKLDKQVLLIAGAHQSASRDIALLCNSLRHLVANMAEPLTALDARLLLQNVILDQEIPRLVKSVLSLPDSQPSLVGGSGRLVGQLIHIIAKAGNNGSSLRTTIYSTFHQSKSCVALAAISRYIISEFSSQRLHDHTFAGFAFETTWRVIIEQSVVNKEISAKFDDASELYFLFGDLLCFSKSQGLDDCWPRPDVKEYFEEKCIASFSSTPAACAQYVVACLAMTEPLPVLARRIAKEITISRHSVALLDAAFTQIVRQMEADDVRSTLERLLKLANNSSERTTNQIQLIGICLRSADETVGSSVLSQKANAIFSMSLSYLAQRPVPVDTALVSCTVLEELLCSRRIVTFRDVDLTRLLFHISAAVGYSEPGNEMTVLPTQLYIACVKLYVTVFKRYFKYLYACAPLVVLVVQAFLARVLYEQDLTDDVIVDRAQRYSRVCELFVDHKEIYKKHVIGLILEYVQAIKEGLSLVRKASLLPAIHLLLDTLSTHELKQLNVLMDPSATIIFKGIYQKYQKFHTYKGK